MERSAESLHLFHPEQTERARNGQKGRTMMMRDNEKYLLRQARRSWEAEHEKAKRDLFDAQLELNRLNLLIKAYEVKLSTQIDPATEEWEETWKELRRTKLLREEYLHGSYMEIWLAEREAHSRTSAAIYPATEEKFFLEWLEKH